MRNPIDFLATRARSQPPAATTGLSSADRDRFVQAAFEHILQRPPTPVELEHWAAVNDHRGPAGVLDLLFESGEYLHRRQAETAEPAPDTARAAAFVQAAFGRILRRPPTPDELAQWTAGTLHLGPGEVLERLFAGNEYLHRNRVDDLSEFYAGHFYSPVVDPEALREQGFRVDAGVDESAVAGIDFRTEAMKAFWARNLPVMAEAPISEAPTDGARYYTRNVVYAWGDALVLTAVMHEARPRQVIEVGSGFSSACMLDVADRLGLPTRFTFIEPYPDRLFGLLTEADHQRCTVLRTGVQQTDPAIFETLAANDILFIDSTHVSKTGSDVNHELFEVLPRLASGVIIHFHDIFYPFEYPEEWIFESRRSWNEAYILRAFLTNNPAYEMLFFNDYFRARQPALAAQVPKFLENPGGGLWLRKV